MLVFPYLKRNYLAKKIEVENACELVAVKPNEQPNTRQRNGFLGICGNTIYWNNSYNSTKS